MVGQLNSGNIQDSALNRNKMSLDFNDPDPNHLPLRAQDIPFDSTRSIKDAVYANSANLLDPFDFNTVLGAASRPLYWGQTASLRASNGYSLDSTGNPFGNAIKLTGTDVDLAYAEMDTTTMYTGSSVPASIAKDFTRFLAGNHAGSNSKLFIIAKVNGVANMDITDGLNIILTSDVTTNGGYTYKVVSSFVDTDWTYITVDLDLPSSVGSYADMTNIHTVTIKSKASLLSTLIVDIAYLGIISADSMLARKIYSNGDVRIFDPCNAVENHSKDAGLTSDVQTALTHVYIGAAGVGTSIRLDTSGVANWEYRRTFETPMDFSGIDSLYVWINLPIVHNFTSLELKLSNENTSYTASTNKLAYSTSVQSDGIIPSGSGWKLFKFSLSNPTGVGGTPNFSTIKSMSIAFNQSAGTVDVYNLGLIYGTSVTAVSVNNSTNTITIPNPAELSAYDTDSLIGYQVRVLNPAGFVLGKKNDSVFHDITGNSKDGSNTYINLEPKRVINPNYSLGNVSRISATATLPSIASYDNAVIEIYSDASIQQSNLPRNHTASILSIDNGELEFGLGLGDLIAGSTNLIQIPVGEQYYLKYNYTSNVLATSGAEIQFDYQDNFNYCSLLLKSLGTNNTCIIQVLRVIAGIIYNVGMISTLGVSGGFSFGTIEIINNQTGVKIYRNNILVVSLNKLWYGGDLIIKGYQTSTILQGFVLDLSSTSRRSFNGWYPIKGTIEGTAIGASVSDAGKFSRVNVDDLTASETVVTDADKKLASIAYASINTFNSIVRRDASGNFTASTITANLTGTATQADNADTVDSVHSSGLGASINNNGNALRLMSATGTQLSSITVTYASNAGNADTVDSVHSSSIGSSIDTSGNNIRLISATSGVLSTITVPYATNTGSAASAYYAA